MGGGHQPTVQTPGNIPPCHGETAISRSVSSEVSLIFAVAVVVDEPHAHPCPGAEHMCFAPPAAQQMVHGSHGQTKLSTASRSTRAQLL